MTKNPFETHGIDHLSPSSINTYIADPCSYILRYLFKHRSASNPAMWRGTVVDESIGRSLGFKKNNKNKWVGNKGKTPKKTAINSAIRQFDGLYRYHLKSTEVDEVKFQKERELVPKYLETAIPYYKSFGQPTSYQKQINLQLDDIPVPIMGFIDLQYEDVVRDIKTTGRLPSAIPSSVSRQLSIYATAENSTPLVDYIYVTKTKAEVVSMFVEDVDEHIATVKKVAHTIMNLLSYSENKQEIADLFYPDFDDWRWSKNDIEIAKTIWSIK
tara:strand:+ start:133 stop:945 length:813 start_codon:yes stop_codon:yes gene_type:complete